MLDWTEIQDIEVGLERRSYVILQLREALIRIIALPRENYFDPQSRTARNDGAVITKLHTAIRTVAQKHAEKRASFEIPLQPLQKTIDIYAALAESMFTEIGLDDQSDKNGSGQGQRLDDDQGHDDFAPSSIIKEVPVNIPQTDESSRFVHSISPSFVNYDTINPEQPEDSNKEIRSVKDSDVGNQSQPMTTEQMDGSKIASPNTGAVSPYDKTASSSSSQSPPPDNASTLLKEGKTETSPQYKEQTSAAKDEENNSSSNDSEPSNKPDEISERFYEVNNLLERYEAS